MPMQVLDLGVTRTLVHRAIKLLPFMCLGGTPLAGSLEATKRVAFERLKFMGRRCRACKADPGYVERELRRRFRFLCMCVALLRIFLSQGANLLLKGPIC